MPEGKARTGREAELICEKVSIAQRYVTQAAGGAAVLQGFLNWVHQRSAYAGTV